MSPEKTTLLLVIATVGLLSPTRAQSTLNVPLSYPSIQAAIDAAQNSDTVLVDAGTYPESIDFHGKQITVLGQGQGLTIISGSPGAAPAVVTFQQNEGPDSVLRLVSIAHTNSVYGPSLAGIRCVGTSPMIRDCQISNLQGLTDEACGLFSSGGSPTLQDCVLSSCIAFPFGYGARLDGGNPIFERCTFDQNFGDNGAGILANQCNLTVRNSTFAHNAPDAGLFVIGGSATVDSCLFVNNSAAGMRLDGGNHSIVNSVVSSSGATMDSGVGAICVSCSPLFLYCTLADNTQGFGLLPPSGLRLIDASPSIQNCIVWANTASIVLLGASAPEVRFCCVEGGWSGPGNISVDPLFDPSTPGAYKLSSVSPCIDAGDGVTVARPEHDRDGDPRVLYFAPDIGSDEWLPLRSIALTAEQSSGPASISLRIASGSANTVYYTLLSSDGRNSGVTAGHGPWAGHWMPVNELVQELAMGYAPFFGTLSGNGESLYSSVLPPGLTGLSFFGIAHTIDTLSARLSACSNLLSWTLL